MTKVRKVCPWECSGSQGEIDVVRAERSRVPNVPATTAVMRCGECHGISMATLVNAPRDSTTRGTSNVGPRWAASRPLAGCPPRSTCAGSSLSRSPHRSSAVTVAGRGDASPYQEDPAGRRGPCRAGALTDGVWLHHATASQSHGAGSVPGLMTNGACQAWPLGHSRCSVIGGPPCLR